MWAGAAAFNVEYGIWVEELHRQMCELRAALRAHVPDNELRLLVEVGTAHCNDYFRIKAVAAKTDVFQLLSGMWLTLAERCFMWMGGLRPSEVLKVHHGGKKKLMVVECC
jgi:transcription factor TGA